MMYLTDTLTDEPSSFTSSPRQMQLDLPSLSSWDNASLKRKRAFDMDEALVGREEFHNKTNLPFRSFKGMSSPCSASIGLSTPALSYSESFHDNHDVLRPQPQPLQRNLSNDSRCSKRLHLAPRPRLSRHISRPSSDLASLPSVTSPVYTVQACHVCSRRPSTIQDLPAYNDCDSCHQRTCFVCMRTCEGSQCQSTNIAMGLSGMYSSGKRICSKCCVEVGADGTVWCTACYEDDSDMQHFHKGNKEQLKVESEGRVAEWLSRFDGDGMDLGSDSVLLDQQFLGL